MKKQKTSLWILALFCIDFASYKSVFLNASMMCQMRFLWIFKSSRVNKVKDVTENDVIILSALVKI